VGEKIAIVSNKPQTTRNKILGILTTSGGQAVFMDTPGIHQPKNKLAEHMVKTAVGAAEGVDAVLFIASALDGADANAVLLNRLNPGKAPVILVINKIDAVAKESLLPLIERYNALFCFAETALISALTGENAAALLDAVFKYLPEGPKYFPDDMITDKPERFIVAEIVREKALGLLRDEVPHGAAVAVDSMKARNKRLVDVSATIYCEKDSHKGMIIGKGGDMLKRIGTLARSDIERVLGSRVNLALWVKVKKDWRESDFYIKSFGCWKE
jgi:GTP-binding protein Era